MSMGRMPVMPKLAKVRVIRQKIPKGATLRMRLIIAIMMELNWVKKRLTVATFLPSMPSKKPRISAKKMICSMVPSASAPKMLVGMMLSRVVLKSVSSAVVVTSLCEMELRSKPRPGLVMLAKPIAMQIDTAVVIRYMRMVPPPTLPNILGSDIDAAPHTMEQSTSGATIICIRRINPWPIT